MKSGILIISSILLIAFVIIILCIVIAITRSKTKSKETESSILDVNDIGVSNNNQEFSYGYEKEETIIMDPVDASKIVNEEEIKNKNIENKSGTKEQN